MKYLLIIMLLCSIPALAVPKKQKHTRAHRVAHKTAHRHHRAARRAHGRYIMARSHKPKVLTEVDRISMQFAAHKGALTMPVVKSSNNVYSEDPSRLYKINNPVNGLDIACANDANVRAVYDGVVTSVFSVDNDGKQIIILQHGHYFTVYNSLAHTAVRKGDYVCANQCLGTVASNDNGQPNLNFQIWKKGDKGHEKLSPEEWLSK